MKIAIYGTGVHARKLLKEINVIGIAVEIIYYIESLRKKDFYEGKSVKN